MTEVLVCNICKEQYEYDSQNRGDARRTKCATCRRRETRERRYREIVEYAGGECEDCGYDGCYASLDFHHIYPSEKEFHINSKTARNAKEDLRSEADKCRLLCSNCHREKECTRSDCTNH